MQSERIQFILQHRPRQAKKNYSKSCRNDNNAVLKLLFSSYDNNAFGQIKETITQMDLKKKERDRGRSIEIRIQHNTYCGWNMVHFFRQQHRQQKSSLISFVLSLLFFASLAVSPRLLLMHTFEYGHISIEISRNYAWMHMYHRCTQCFVLIPQAFSTFHSFRSKTNDHTTI